MLPPHRASVIEYYLIKVYIYFYFIVGLRASQRLHPIVGIRPPWRQHWQSVNLQGGCEGLKRAATSRILGIRGYVAAWTVWRLRNRSKNNMRLVLVHSLDGAT